MRIFPLFKKKDLLNWPEKGICSFLFLSFKNRAKLFERDEREREKLSRIFLLFSFLNNKLNLFLVMGNAY
jgi:hypothetical protein